MLTTDSSGKTNLLCQNVTPHQRKATYFGMMGTRIYHAVIAILAINPKLSGHYDRSWITCQLLLQLFYFIHMKFQLCRKSIT
jgi:hypothetical protein